MSPSVSAAMGETARILELRRFVTEKDDAKNFFEISFLNANEQMRFGIYATKRA